MNRKGIKSGVITSTLSLALIGFACALPFFDTHAQVNQTPVQQDKNARATIPNELMAYTPADFQFNNDVLPASLSTPNSAIVNVARVHELTLGINCDQIVDVYVQTYAADGTTALGAFKLFSAVATGEQQIYIGARNDPSATSGTASAKVHLPQRAASFYATNTTATPGHCTARLLAQY